MPQQIPSRNPSSRNRLGIFWDPRPSLRRFPPRLAPFRSQDAGSLRRNTNGRWIEFERVWTWLLVGSRNLCRAKSSNRMIDIEARQVQAPALFGNAAAGLRVTQNLFGGECKV